MFDHRDQDEASVHQQVDWIKAISGFGKENGAA